MWLLRLLAVFMVTMVSLICLACAGSASKIGVQIFGNVKSDFKVTAIEENGNVIAAYLSAHNTGSFEYDAKARIDIMSGDRVLFTGWSETRYLNPGQRRGFVVYGYKPVETNLSIRARLYCGNEITELENIGIGDGEAAGNGAAFGVLNFRTYDSYIRFELLSNRSVDNVLVIPTGYPGTWVFGQKLLVSVGEGKAKEVIIPYSVGLFRGRNITIAVATADGAHYSEHEFRLEREAGIMKYLHMFMDWLGGFFRS